MGMDCTRAMQQSIPYRTLAIWGKLISFHMWLDGMALRSHEDLSCQGRRADSSVLFHIPGKQASFSRGLVQSKCPEYMCITEGNVHLHTYFACSFSLPDSLGSSHGCSIQLGIWKSGSVGHLLPWFLSGYAKVLWILVFSQDDGTPLCCSAWQRWPRGKIQADPRLREVRHGRESVAGR